MPTQIIKYNPLSLLEELSDEQLLEIKYSGQLNTFCYGLTLDLMSPPEKADC